MDDWIQVKGLVTQGYGVASGQAKDPRFPQGTIDMQKPFFAQQGLDLNQYFPGTINLSIAPHRYQIKAAKQTFKSIQWSPSEPAEDFSFFDCKIVIDKHQVFDGLIYYPHPETKPEHFQSPDVLEIMTAFISGLEYTDEVILAVKRQQIHIL